MAREKRIRGLTTSQWMEANSEDGLSVELIEWDRTTESAQAVSGDANLAAAVGTSTGNQHRTYAGVMGNVARTGNLSATSNTIAGVVGRYIITGTNAGNYPKAGVVGEIWGAVAGQTAAAADGAFVAVLGGDEGAIRARAAYTVDFENTGIHSGNQSYFNWGLDLQGPGTHDGYMTGFYNDGFIRMGGVFPNAGTNETVTAVAIIAGTAVPTNGVSGTGAANAGAGSLYIRQSGAASVLYINTNTLASPTWTVVGTQT